MNAGIIAGIFAAVLPICGIFLFAAYRILKWQAQKEIEAANYRTYERSNELHLLKDLAEILNQTLPPDRTLYVGIEQVARRVGAVSAWCLTLTENNMAEISAGYQLPPHMEQACKSNRPWALCACLRETASNQLTSPRLFECERLAAAKETISEQKQHLTIPIHVRGTPVGILNLVFPAERTFDDAETRLLSALGNQFGGAIERAQLFKEVNKLAITDSLTGLYNRRHFQSAALKEMERARRYNHITTLAILDIDAFKRINDTFGHLAGDKALQEISRLCLESIRQQDVVGRFGGEEITILMPETSLEKATQAMDRLRQAVEALEISTPRGVMRLTISVGLTSLNDNDTLAFDQFLDRADLALYQAKNGGRNQVRVL